MSGSILTDHLCPREKKHWDAAGIEPGSPAQQATTLSTTPCLSGLPEKVAITDCCSSGTKFSKVFASKDEKLWQKTASSGQRLLTSSSSGKPRLVVLLLIAVRK